MRPRPDTTTVLRQGVADPAVVARYRGFVWSVPLRSGCLIWTGAVSGRGHGRFWIGGGRVIVAHRFGYALIHGVDALRQTPMIRHTCDEPLCQTPAHWAAGTAAANAADWAGRRHTPGSPLRDKRGAAGRARSLRDAALTGLNLDQVADLGLPELDRYQEPLPI